MASVAAVNENKILKGVKSWRGILRGAEQHHASQHYLILCHLPLVSSSCASCGYQKSILCSK